MRVIDADTHLREDYAFEDIYQLEGEFAELSPKRVKGGAYHEMQFEHSFLPWGEKPAKSHSHRNLYDPSKWGGRIAAIQEGGADLDKRDQDFEGSGVDQQVLFGTQLHIPILTEGPLGLALSRCYNDWVHKLIKGREDRLFPVAATPAGHPEAMAGELTRAVKELGFKAGMLAAYTPTRTLDDPAFDPYFAAAEKLDVPLFVHPNSQGELINRFTNFFAMHVLARPLNCTAALVGLVIGGAFERFPKLRVGFFECGAEWILYWMRRLDMDYEYLAEDYAPYLTMKPSDYIRRNCYVTCDAREPMLPMAIEQLGEGRILMASDYPHWDTGFPHVVGEIRERTDISEKQKELILGGNIADMMRL